MQIVSEEPVPRVAGEILRAARRQARKTQREAGRICGVPQSVFSDYERGAREPSLSTLRRLLAPLGFDLDMTLVRRVTDDNRLSGPIGTVVLARRRAVVQALERHGATRVWVVGRVVEGHEHEDFDGVQLHADIDPAAPILTVMADVDEVFHSRFPIHVHVAYPLHDGGILLPSPPFVELTGQTLDDPSP